MTSITIYCSDGQLETTPSTLQQCPSLLSLVKKNKININLPYNSISIILDYLRGYYKPKELQKIKMEAVMFSLLEEENLIVINVGGKYFMVDKVSLSTMFSYFEKFFEWNKEHHPNYTKILIDRSSEVFEEIISYLRSFPPQELNISSSPKVTKRLMKDLDYYGYRNPLDLYHLERTDNKTLTRFEINNGAFSYIYNTDWDDSTRVFKTSIIDPSNRSFEVDLSCKRILIQYEDFTESWIYINGQSVRCCSQNTKINVSNFKGRNTYDQRHSHSVRIENGTIKNILLVHYVKPRRLLYGMCDSDKKYIYSKGRIFTIRPNNRKIKDISFTSRIPLSHVEIMKKDEQIAYVSVAHMITDNKRQYHLELKVPGPKGWTYLIGGESDDISINFHLYEEYEERIEVNLTTCSYN